MQEKSLERLPIGTYYFVITFHYFHLKIKINSAQHLTNEWTPVLSMICMANDHLSSMVHLNPDERNVYTDRHHFNRCCSYSD